MIGQHRNVTLGKNPQLGEFVVIGIPPRGKSDGELPTVIGDDAVIRSHTVIYSGNKIGSNLQTGHFVAIREENSLGNNVSIGTGSIIEHHIIIEDEVRIHSHAFIPEFSLLKKGCWIGPHAVLTNAKYPKSKSAKKALKGPTIGENAKVGANVTILPCIVIGKDAIVGAGSVVTKDVPPGKVVVGNPARIIGDSKDIEAYQD